MARKKDLSKDLLKILLERKTLTRQEFGTLTGARPATILEAVDELKKCGIIAEPGRNSKKTGRKSPQLTLNPDSTWVIGIDFQVKKTIGTIIDAQGKICSKLTIPAGKRRSLEECRSEIADVIRKLLNENRAHCEKLKAIGFADPGMVDVNNGISLKAVNIPGWENADTAAWLRKEFGLPSFIFPAESVIIYMEYRNKLPKPPQSIFHLGTGDGIGGGFIKNGEIFSGSFHRAMEIGHIIIMPGGPVCQCGNRGCLEALAGESGILRRINEAIKSGVDTSLDTANFSIAHFAECVKHDKLAKIIAAEVCTYIGSALAVITTLLNPELIVISGELTAIGSVLPETVKRVLSQNCFPGVVMDLKLEISALPPDVTACGAALLARNQIFEERFASY
ncbi:MAG: ROK family protein [Victivallaceae bacterium]|nr:ROK family protein [Victivallaceae bacterium]MDD3116227.1 ROK family protein [Victivallaceae bacterium]MDD3703350.1 ROK family protein [Victivallaceae bacterium]MDD4317033.1 ROK family protein [Victivallaceae bacterium]NLK83988.1 ROK family protein [Lentisphaerota bacterium]